jgi:nicotinate-nucleotide--dimethylbenzimidazole phosphoribosyltransferase
MRARIPYLARLARPDAGPVALRPPRPLFASDLFTPRPAAYDGSSRRAAGTMAARVAASAAQPADAAREPPTSRGIVTPFDADTRGERPGGALPAVSGAGPVAPADPLASADPVAPAGPDLAALTAPQPPLAGPDPRLAAAVAHPPLAPAAGTARMADVGGPAASAAPDLPGQPATPRRPSGPRAGSPTGASMSPALPLAGPAAHPAGPARPALPEAPADTAPPASVPHRGTPVELPRAANPAADVLASPPGRGTASAPRALDDADGRLRPGGIAAVHDLLPSPGPAYGPIEQSSPGPGGSRQPGGAERPQVSIGTIEVTVVPPTRPEPAAGVQPPARAAGGHSRDGSRTAAGAGSDRMRSGLRRWYGTAQG